MILTALTEGEELIPCDDFLQCEFWGAFKASFGWKNLRFRMDIAAGSPEREECGLLVLLRRLGPGLSFAYVAHGPYIDPLGRKGRGESLSLEYAANSSSEEWGAEPQAALAGKLLDISQALAASLPADCAFIRFDLPQYRQSSAQKPLPPPFRKAGADVQPPDTVVLDLSPGEEALLSAMKPKWRYNVKLAEKKGVAIRCLDARSSSAAELDGGVETFYALYRETAARDRIALHGKSYYRALFDASARDGKAPLAKLYLAESGGKALASIIVLSGAREAVYLYGASSNEGRNLMPAYALQWRAMRDAKASGCERYDLFGIPPDEDPAHPMHGLYRFKTGFGGRVLHRLGCWDYPIKRLAYAAFGSAERARAFWFKRVMKAALRPRKGGAGGKAKAEE